jgi:nitrate reductase gamma subunit
MRSQPVFSGAVFLFHICLLAVPLFLNAHNILWEEAFGASLWSLPDAWADGLTLALLATAVGMIVRRIVRPEVRILTSAWDYTLIGLTVLPFLAGFLAYHQLGPYDMMMLLHIADLPMLAGDREAGGQQVQNVYDKARELGAEASSSRSAAMPTAPWCLKALTWPVSPAAGRR